MDTKEHIKEAALELFAKQGYDGVSVRDIIEKAKVNLGAISYHFGSKEDLYREMIQDMGNKLKGELDKIKTLPGTNSEKLEEYIRTFMTLVLENPTHSRMMIREMGMGGKRFMEIMQPFAGINFGTLHKIIQEGIRGKEFQSMDPQLTAFSILAVCVHYINVQPMIFKITGKTRYEEEFIDKVVQHTVRFVLSALKVK